MEKPDPFEEIDGFFGPYSAAFRSGDMAAIDALFEYPYVLSNADGIREVANSDFYKSLHDALKEKAWIGSRFDSFRKFRTGEDGAMVVVDYSRLRPDGTVINSGKAAYLMRHRPDGWKLVGILDGFPG